MLSNKQPLEVTETKEPTKKHLAADAFVEQELKSLIAKAELNKKHRKTKANFNLKISRSVYRNKQGEVIDFDYTVVDKNDVYNKDFISSEQTLKKLIREAFSTKDKFPLSLNYYDQLRINMGHIYHLFTLSGAALTLEEDRVEFEKEMTIDCKLLHQDMFSDAEEWLFKNYDALIKAIKHFEKELKSCDFQGSVLFENIAALAIANIKKDTLKNMVYIKKPLLRDKAGIEILKEGVKLAKEAIDTYANYFKQILRVLPKSTKPDWELLLRISGRFDASRQFSIFMSDISSFIERFILPQVNKLGVDLMLEFIHSFVRLQEEIILLKFRQEKSISSKISTELFDYEITRLSKKIDSMFSEHKDLLSKFKDHYKFSTMRSRLLLLAQAKNKTVFKPITLQDIKLKCFEIEELTKGYIVETSVKTVHSFDFPFIELLDHVDFYRSYYPENFALICENLFELISKPVVPAEEISLTREEKTDRIKLISNSRDGDYDPDGDNFNQLLSLFSEKVIDFDTFKDNAKKAILMLKQLGEQILEQEQDQFNSKVLDKLKKIKIKSKKKLVPIKTDVAIENALKTLDLKESVTPTLSINNEFTAQLLQEIDDNDSPWISVKESRKGKSHKKTTPSENPSYEKYQVRPGSRLQVEEAKATPKKSSVTKNPSAFFTGKNVAVREYPYSSFALFKQFYETIESSLRTIESVDNRVPEYRGLREIQRDLVVANLLYKKQAINPLSEARMLALNALHHWYVSRSAAEDKILRPDSCSRFRKILVMTTDVQTFLIAATSKLCLLLSPPAKNLPIMLKDIRDTFDLIKDTFNLVVDLRVELTKPQTIEKVEKAIHLFRNFKFSTPNVKAPELLSTISFREKRLSGEINACSKLIDSFGQELEKRVAVKNC